METNSKKREWNEKEKALLNIAKECYSFICHQLIEEGVCSPYVDAQALTDVVFVILHKSLYDIKVSLGEERATELFEEFIELIQYKFYGDVIRQGEGKEYGTKEDTEPAH